MIADLSGALVVSDTSQATLTPPELGDQDGKNELDLETLPFAHLSLHLGRSDFGLGYGPRFLLRDALDDEETFLLHAVTATYSYTAERSRLALGFTGTLGRDSLSAPALLPPAPAAPAPTAPAPAPAPSPGVPSTSPGVAATAAPVQPQPQPLELRQSVAALSAEIRYTYTMPRYTLSIAQTGEMSRQSLAELALIAPIDATSTPAPTTTTTLDLVNSQPVKTGNEVTSASLDYAWSRRLRSTFTLSYGIFGGLDDEARELIPVQRTAAGLASLTEAVTKRDDLGTTLAVTQTEASNGNDSWLVAITEAWNRTWTPDVTSTVNAGVAVTSTGNDESDEREVGVEPTAGASVNAVLLRAAVDTLLTAHAAAGVSPTVNGLTGELQTGVGVSAGTELRVDDSALSADASMGQTLPPGEQGAARVVTVGLGASQQVAEIMFLSAQYRSVWQHVGDDSDTDGAATSLPRLWSAIFTLALVGPAVDF